MHAYLVEPDARWQWRDLIFAELDKVKGLGRVVRRAAHPVRVSPHALDHRERGRSHVARPGRADHRWICPFIGVKRPWRLARSK
jgi:hypothetical protein